MLDKKLTDAESKEAKSLRWLAIQFPRVENPKDDADRLCNCINIYCSNGADLINRLKADYETLNQQEEKAHQYCKNVCEPKYKAEVERLKDYNENLQTANTALSNEILETKAEAYKEFAERSEKEIFIKQDDKRKQLLKILKTYRGTRAYSDTEQATDNWLRGYGEAVQDIICVFDNLLKELVGDGQ